MADDGAVAWTLVPAPDLGRVAYRAEARCPHGSSQHLIFGRAALLLATADTVLEVAAGLTFAHDAQVGCGCSTGAVTIAAPGDGTYRA